MKIYKGLLKDMSEHEGIEKYQNGEMYKKVLRIYRKLVREYYDIALNITVPKEVIMNETFKSRKNTLTARAVKARSRIKQIKKIIEICKKLDVDIESYITAQFRLIYPEFKKTHPNGVIKLTRLITPLAVERFTQLATGREKRVSINGIAKIKKKKIVDIERVMLFSVRAIERRLLVVSREVELDSDIVNDELMRLLRFKKISLVYVYSSDFIAEHGNKILKIKQKLSEKQKNTIVEFKNNYSFNKELEVYVR